MDEIACTLCKFIVNGVGDGSAKAFAVGSGGMDGPRGGGNYRVANARKTRSAGGAGTFAERFGMDRRSLGGLPQCVVGGIACTASAGCGYRTGAVLRRDLFCSNRGRGSTALPYPRPGPVDESLHPGKKQGP